MTLAIKKAASAVTRGTAEGPTVSDGYARAAFDIAVQAGADPAALAAQSGYDGRSDGDPERRIPLDAYCALLRAGAALTGDPAFALRFGFHSQFEEISIVGLITHAAPTMADAFEQMNRYARLAVEVPGHGPAARFALVRRDGDLWIEDRRPNPDVHPELTEATVARFIGNMTRHMPGIPFARHVSVTHRAPPHAAAYAEVLGVPVRFGAAHNAIAIDPAWPSIPLPSANRYVFGIFAKRGDALLETLLKEKSLAGRVEATLLPILHTGQIGASAIARRLGMSPATLYRRLKSEHAQFADILDGLRRRMAGEYLADRRVSVGETAYLLGYADAASFSRAFKRWHGRSPGGRA
jgi:AraC-like DNA-binding protein